MRKAILTEIINAADALDVPLSAKDQFKRMVRQMGIDYGVAGMANAERIDFARRLLDARTSRATIRNRLMALFNVSRSQAYTIIQTALNRPD